MNTATLTGKKTVIVTFEPIGEAEPVTGEAQVIVADLKQAAREVLNSPFGEQVIVQTVNGKKLEMGFNT